MRRVSMDRVVGGSSRNMDFSTEKSKRHGVSTAFPKSK